MFGAQDFDVGEGEVPQDGQEVEFHYSAYNENGNRIDSTYLKGKPAKTRLGIKGLIPGETFAHFQPTILNMSLSVPSLALHLKNILTIVGTCRIRRGDQHHASWRQAQNCGSA